MDEAFIKKVQPNSPEAEQSVIGAMIMDRDAIADVIDIVSADDFYQKQNGILFEAMTELYREGKPVDLITLQNRLKEKEAFKICKKKIREHGLEMKLIDAEYTFDNNKVLFYFTADGRIDFRQLVKDLASVFKTRIELRQIGVRDETKILGGIGICGRTLCCHTYLSEFAPVSIKMAKEQNLSLNQTKISGVCGRLMCCLKNEQETYEYLNSKLPNVGEKLKTKDGVVGEVQRVDVLRQKVKLIVEDENGDKEIQEYKIDDLVMRKKKPQGCQGCSKGCNNKNQGCNKGHGKRKN